MADAYTPEEIQEIFEAYNEAIRTGTPISKELSMAMRDASVGVKGATAAMVADFGKMGKSAADFTKAMYKGEQGAAAMSDAVDTLTTGLEILLAVIMPGSLALRAAIALTVGAVVKYGKTAAEMSDKLYNAYQGLSRVGSAGEQGMSAVYGSMQKFAYGIDELDKMTALIRENSKNLALFSGTVLDGSNALANTAETIQRSGLQTEFLKMGMSVDDINRGIAGYYGQLGRLGQLQGKSQSDLTAGTTAYLREMEALSRLTGQQREEMEKQREQANQVDQFLAQVQKMGDAGQEAYKAFNILSSASPELAKQMASSFSGFITDESSQIFMLTGGAITQLNEQLRTGQITGDEYAKAVGRAAATSADFQQNLALIPGAFKEFGGVYQDAINLQQLQNKDMAKAVGQTKPIDGLTASQVELRQKQMATRDALQDFVKLGVDPATSALNALAGASKSAANSLPGAGNKTNPGGGTSGGWLRDFLGLPPPGGAKSTSAGLEGVNADLATAVQKATAEYEQVTGKKATITSGVRDYQKQKELYDAWIAGGKKGNPVAPPGTSHHETGSAVDINSEAANYMDQAGILKKYGLTRPVAGDAPHVELAGARNGYNTTVNAKPASDMKVANSSDQYNQMVNNNSDEIDGQQQIIDLLAQQIRLQQDQLSVQEKTRQAVS